MAGAIIGAVAGEGPPGALLDDDYIREQAMRLCGISEGAESQSFPYPDLLTWQPPETQQDAVGLFGDKLAVTGLGTAQANSQLFESRSKGDAVWQWVRLDFGQTLLAKRRKDLKALPVTSLPETSSDQKVPPRSKIYTSDVMRGAQSKPTHRKAYSEQPTLFSEHPPDDRKKIKYADLCRQQSLHDMTGAAIKSGFDAELMGIHLLELTSRADGIEQAIAYTAIIAKARAARLRHTKQLQPEE